MLRKRTAKAFSSPAKNDTSTSSKTPKLEATTTQTTRTTRQVERDAIAILEKQVFGGDHHVINNLVQPGDAKETLLDREEEEVSRKPVWEDPEEKAEVLLKEGDFRFKNTRRKGETAVKGVVYQRRLENEVVKTWGSADWGELKSGREAVIAEEDYLMHGTGKYLASGTSRLPRELLKISKKLNINKERHTKGRVNALQFHPTATVALVAGGDRTLNLFQVDGKTNAKIHSIYLDNFPILAAKFSADGQEVIMGSKHKSFYYYDMIAGKVVQQRALPVLNGTKMSRFEVSPCGRFFVFLGKQGHLHVFAAKSKELITTFKMNGSVHGITFTSDGSKLFAYGDEAEVYVFDMHSRQCVHRFLDEGCVKGLSIAACPNNKYLACGSNSGVVNVYEMDTALKSQSPHPCKAVSNLVYGCTHLTFNHTSEILAMSSNHTENALRLLHFPSLTVFSDFPSKSLAVGTVQQTDFSQRSGYLGMGDGVGRGLLFRLEHFEEY